MTSGIASKRVDQPVNSSASMLRPQLSRGHGRFCKAQKLLIRRLLHLAYHAMDDSASILVGRSVADTKMPQTDINSSAPVANHAIAIAILTQLHQKILIANILVDEVHTEAVQDQAAKYKVRKRSFGADFPFFHQFPTDCVDCF